ncbi:hypothetical protein IGI04_042824 [Brassica rapa subsp. trilocularis]|uniref:AB hydrolase-1 domain-containing protein n=1 Tax=Brassica rapa subsp. trilocularis TaxID=1813537 RepID=A0ABQ7KL28_BRACM|nr:hypothetical protein IGI04_042824 [Brassica rapa subsp. trilocularis]
MDALIKMLKDNGNIHGYSFGASMIARTIEMTPNVAEIARIDKNVKEKEDERQSHHQTRKVWNGSDRLWIRLERALSIQLLDRLDGKSLVAYMGAPNSRNNDQDFIRKADIDALIKMFKDNGNIYGYSYGASMIARTVGDLDCITITDTTPTSDHGGERSEPETTQESSGASGTHDQDVEGMTVQIRERKGEGGWKAKPPSDAEGLERIRPFMDKVGARLIYPALGQAVKPYSCVTF